MHIVNKMSCAHTILMIVYLWWTKADCNVKAMVRKEMKNEYNHILYILLIAIFLLGSLLARR